jgi:hypothetical protein
MKSWMRYAFLAAVLAGAVFTVGCETPERAEKPFQCRCDMDD